jgi:hypothetical protein
MNQTENLNSSTTDANPHPTAITRHSDEGEKITVIPAQAGIQYVFPARMAANQRMTARCAGSAHFWIPACAGMTRCIQALDGMHSEH